MGTGIEAGVLAGAGSRFDIFECGDRVVMAGPKAVAGVKVRGGSQRPNPYMLNGVHFRLAQTGSIVNMP